jgi:hypothetical protein
LPPSDSRNLANAPTKKPKADLSGKYLIIIILLGEVLYLCFRGAS